MPFAPRETESTIVRRIPLAQASLLLASVILAGCALAGDRAGINAPRATGQSTTAVSESAALSVGTATPEATSTLAQQKPVSTLADPQPTADPPDQEASEAVEVADAESAIPTPQAHTHTVAAGETLTRIAALYDVSMDALINANELPNPDYLEVGQVINLPQAPVDYTPSFRMLPDSRLVRSIGSYRFDVEAFLRSQAGALAEISVLTPTRLADGSQRNDALTASQIIDRVSREYSVDARLLLVFLEHFARLVTVPAEDEDALLHPFLPPEPSAGAARAGLYNQLSWLANQLNMGYYDWKYRGKTILETAEGSRLFFHPDLNAGAIAGQFAAAQISEGAEWESDVGESGLHATYRRLFGDLFNDAFETAPADLRQPELTLPFPRGDLWRFTGGFHGGWGNGSAWSAIDFAPPDEIDAGWCYTSKFPTTAIARGVVARLDDGVVVLDLDGDGDEGSGWTILYLHISPHDALREGQIVDAGNILGFVSCAGGFSTATHLHIARRYNGEWIPADCNRCPSGRDAPPFVMGDWQVVGLGRQLYQGFLVNLLDNRSVIAEQGRHTDVNAISW